MPRKGYKQTPEHRRAKRGVVNQSVETRAKISAARMGHEVSIETRAKISAALTGQPHTPERVAKAYGRKCTSETIAKMSGPNNPRWRGGIHKADRDKAMVRPEYKQWRRAVYQRDGYDCTTCGGGTRNLNAHHLLSWAKHPTLRYEVANGITTCADCHHKFWHGKSMKLAG